MGEGYLFPLAVYIPGWHHTWDGALRDALFQLPWFAAYLKVLKAFVRSFKSEGIRIAISKMYKFSIAEIKILMYACPAFANWRWTTMLDCCLHTLQLRFLQPVWERIKVMIMKTSKDETETA